MPTKKSAIRNRKDRYKRIVLKAARGFEMRLKLMALGIDIYPNAETREKDMKLCREALAGFRYNGNPEKYGPVAKRHS